MWIWVISVLKEFVLKILCIPISIRTDVYRGEPECLKSVLHDAWTMSSSLEINMSVSSGGFLLRKLKNQNKAHHGNTLTSLSKLALVSNFLRPSNGACKRYIWQDNPIKTNTNKVKWSQHQINVTFLLWQSVLAKMTSHTVLQCITNTNTSILLINSVGQADYLFARTIIIL